ncbi:Phosphatidylinositol 4-phosphate 5-kinase type-1 alpha [Thelohanellus kitauei]|uniref:Phosphatidylinositol 4-phosphate 5-kinase type-1 alpha n=1 Tax=Thelohanellus kitauei TaxID=669202 RepID=A0A0C2IZF9_THEKT|nr:Phosphatidylinositol 4-phosphate 5-kinase type-1 alpha [Thelohanellus kitauei]
MNPDEESPPNSLPPPDTSTETEADSYTPRSTLKRITSNSTSTVMKCTQLGITRAITGAESMEDRDILIKDFFTVVIYFFPSSGSTANKTPPHPFNDFKFKDYSPAAFKYFRKAYSIESANYMKSLCGEELKELSSSGASGSMFFKSHDDLYVLKSLDHREAKFMHQIMAGYFLVF